MVSYPFSTKSLTYFKSHNKSEAMKAKPEFIVEMDGGGSHDPRALHAFVRAMTEGNECAFGSRYINGGSMVGSPFKRRFLSKFGSFVARVLLGCLLRYRNWIEVPIHYTSPSPRVSAKALANARQCPIYYTFKHWVSGGLSL